MGRPTLIAGRTRRRARSDPGRSFGTGLALSFVLALVVHPGYAQSTGQLVVGAGTLTGGDFEGVDRGLALAARWMWGGGAFQRGLEFDYLRVEVEGSDGPLTQLDALIVARYRLSDDRVRPFVSGSVGTTSHRLAGGPATLIARGFTLGVGAGIQTRIGAPRIEVGVDARSLWMGALEANGVADPTSRASGFRVAGLIALAVPI